MLYLTNKISGRKFKVVTKFSDGDIHMRCVETGIDYISRKHDHIADDWEETEEKDNV